LFALLSCFDGISRRVHLMETVRERIRAQDGWDDRTTGCGMPNCVGDHVVMDFQPEVKERENNASTISFDAG